MLTPSRDTPSKYRKLTQAVAPVLVTEERSKMKDYTDEMLSISDNNISSFKAKPINKKIMEQAQKLKEVPKRDAT